MISSSNNLKVPTSGVANTGLSGIRSSTVVGTPNIQYAAGSPYPYGYYPTYANSYPRGLTTGVPLVGSGVVPTAGPLPGEIKGESRVEYVPYEKKVIEYEPVERTQYVPYERKVIEYEERKRIEQVPVERTYTDYYAIEHITEYMPQVIPETKIEYVPVERIENRVEYYPIQRQVVHYPEEMGRSVHHSNYSAAVLPGSRVVGTTYPRTVPSMNAPTLPVGAYSASGLYRSGLGSTLGSAYRTSNLYAAGSPTNVTFTNNYTQPATTTTGVLGAANYASQYVASGNTGATASFGGSNQITGSGVKPTTFAASTEVRTPGTNLGSTMGTSLGTSNTNK